MALSSSRTCWPALTGGKELRVSSSSLSNNLQSLSSDVVRVGRQRGCKTLSEATWTKQVDETRQREFPSLVLLWSRALIVLSSTTTSWKPARTLPAVRYSSCLPAWTKRKPSGTFGLTAAPSLRQTVSPGYLHFPWTVKKFKSAWKPARTAPVASRSPPRSDPVGARRWGPLSRSFEKVSLGRRKPMASISATLAAVAARSDPQAFIVGAHSSRKASGTTSSRAFSSGNSVSFGRSPTRQKNRHFWSGRGGQRDRDPRLRATSQWFRGTSTNAGVTPI
mmetsp:Transcript_8492/g.27832  ORF Transcript_8492/g.27832 Transcript_8492/m.27832 type:complete len:278 (+) Transcript_8492:202-1035(+)